MQGQRNGAPDRARSPGHERGFAGQVEHESLRTKSIGWKRESPHLVRRADGKVLSPAGDALGESAKHLSGTELIERRRSAMRHSDDGFAPAYGCCHLGH